MKFPSNLCIGIVLTYSSLSFAQSGVSQGETQTPQCICVVNGSNHYKTSFAPQTTIEETNAPSISDGIFREYRLAVFMAYEGFNSEKLGKDISKVKSFWQELEAYLNNIYVRDLGVHFTIIQDERLIEKTYKQVYNYNSGTNLINTAIGSDAYDIGIVVNYIDESGLQGLASLGGVQYQDRKGWAIVNSQDMVTIGHELGHLFGADHPFVSGAGLVGRYTEPKSGQSIMSYGYPYKDDFISLESLRMMRPITSKSDYKLPVTAKHTSSQNTAPKIDRTKMRAEYIVPQDTFFTIPVYASDAEQSSLLYTFNQFGCNKNSPATFPVFPPQHDSKLSFGRRYSSGGSIVANSDIVPVGNYQFWLSVSDALPINEAITKKQAPLYDSYIANVKVVPAIPFKITSEIKPQYSAGQKLHLTWAVDKTFFKKESKVRIVMSDDFGETFSHILVPSTENDGECDVFLPQQLMDKFSTFANIWFAGKGLIRLETIDDDLQYYDISNNDINGGGIEIIKSPVTFQGLPSNYIKLPTNAPLPEVPRVTAIVDNQPITPTFSEKTVRNTTIRTWIVQYNGQEYGGQQFIEHSQGMNIATIKKEEPLIYIENNTLFISKVPNGQWLNILDIQGRLLHQVKSNGEPLRITLPKISHMLLINIENHTYKVLPKQP
jgi:putative PPE-repeat protein